MNNEYLEITDRLEKNESRIAWLSFFAAILSCRISALDPG